MSIRDITSAFTLTCSVCPFGMESRPQDPSSCVTKIAVGNKIYKLVGQQSAMPPFLEQKVHLVTPRLAFNRVIHHPAKLEEASIAWE